MDKWTAKREKKRQWINRIDGKQSTKDGFWKHVDEMLEFLYKEFPIEMIDHEVKCDFQRALSKNKYHSNTDMSARTIGSPPERLYSLLHKIYNQLEDVPYPSQKEFWRAFYKRYPQFSYADKI